MQQASEGSEGFARIGSWAPGWSGFSWARLGWALRVGSAQHPDLPLTWLYDTGPSTIVPTTRHLPCPRHLAIANVFRYACSRPPEWGWAVHIQFNLWTLFGFWLLNFMGAGSPQETHCMMIIQNADNLPSTRIPPSPESTPQA